jgi:hypothetical protein
MTDTQAPYYTASITGGTFALKVRPPRCEVGEALYQEWCAAVDALRLLKPGWQTSDAETVEAERKAEAAMTKYFEHKNGVFEYSQRGMRKKQTIAPCDPCYQARKAAG